MTELTKSNFLKNLQEELGGTINRREKFYLIHFLCTNISSSGIEDPGDIRSGTINYATQMNRFTLQEQYELVGDLLKQVELEREEG